MPGDQLRVGRVVAAHGVEGAVRVEPLTDFPDRFEPGSHLLVNGRPLTVSTAMTERAPWVVRFQEIADRSAAEKLVNLYLTVPVSAARPLPDGRFYHYELVGLSVVDQASGRVLGRVAEVLTYAANDVLRVVDNDAETLVPMVRSIVRAVDQGGGRILVDLPPTVQA